MTKVSVQSHRDGKELAPEVMISNHPAVTGITVLFNVLSNRSSVLALSPRELSSSCLRLLL